MSMTRNLLTLALTAAALSLSAGAHAADPVSYTHLDAADE